jgi:hypothetical protein
LYPHPLAPTYLQARGAHYEPTKKSNIPAGKLAAYDKLIAANPKIERKGATVPCTSLNGHTFSYLNSVGSMALTHKSRWGDELTAEKTKECVWLRPEAVARIEFLEWTEGDRLRHSKFVGLPDDKNPREVVKEA